MKLRRSLPATIALAALLFGCGDEDDGDDGPAPLHLAALVARYEAETLSRAELVRRLGDLPAAPAAELPATIEGTYLLLPAAEPYRVAATTTVSPSATLVLAPGVSIAMAAGATLDVKGKLYAFGTAARPITIAGARDALYKAVALSGGRSELVGAVMSWGESLVTVTDTNQTPLLIEDSQLDNWKVSAIEMSMADGLIIRRNQIGMQTAPEDAGSEALHGKQSAVRVEANVFGRRTGYNDVFDLQPCKDPHIPVLIGNTFLGGDDDAIDLDTCDAIIVGNRFKDFRPDPLTARGQANGGGVTGDGDSSPIVANNVIENCDHAIGFKNGARPLIINNTVMNSDIGITVYSAAAPAPAADAIVINNVFHDNKTDVVLNGSWYRFYDPTITGTVQAISNVIRDPAIMMAMGNLDVDPLIESRDGIPHLGVGSPARASGEGDLALLASKSIFPPDKLREVLERDFLGNPRPFAGGKFLGIDRGAIQNR